MILFRRYFIWYSVISVILVMVLSFIAFVSGKDYNNMTLLHIMTMFFSWLSDKLGFGTESIASWFKKQMLADKIQELNDNATKEKEPNKSWNIQL